MNPRWKSCEEKKAEELIAFRDIAIKKGSVDPILLSNVLIHTGCANRSSNNVWVDIANQSIYHDAESVYELAVQLLIKQIKSEEMCSYTMRQLAELWHSTCYNSEWRKTDKWIDILIKNKAPLFHAMDKSINLIAPALHAQGAKNQKVSPVINRIIYELKKVETQCRPRPSSYWNKKNNFRYLLTPTLEEYEDGILQNCLTLINTGKEEFFKLIEIHFQKYIPKLLPLIARKHSKSILKWYFKVHPPKNWTDTEKALFAEELVIEGNESHTELLLLVRTQSLNLLKASKLLGNASHDTKEILQLVRADKTKLLESILFDYSRYLTNTDIVKAVATKPTHAQVSKYLSYSTPNADHLVGFLDEPLPAYEITDMFKRNSSLASLENITKEVGYNAWYNAHKGPTYPSIHSPIWGTTKEEEALAFINLHYSNGWKLPPKHILLKGDRKKFSNSVAVKILEQVSKMKTQQGIVPDNTISADITLI